MTKKTWVIVALAFVSLASGMTTQYLEPGVDFPRSGVPFSLIAITLIFAWYYLDTEEIQYPRSVALNICIVAFCAMALPYYFFRSRGFKKGLLYSVIAFAILMCLQWIESGGAYVISYGIQK